MKLKEIKEIQAVNITEMKTAEVQELYKNEKGFKTLGVSIGVYGVNGALVKGKTTGTLYKNTKRNGNLYIIL